MAHVQFVVIRTNFLHGFTSLVRMVVPAIK